MLVRAVVFVKIELLAFNRLDEQKNLKNMLYYSHAAIFLPNLTSLTRLSQNRLDTSMALLGKNSSEQCKWMNWRQTIEITYKFSHGLKVR